MAVSNVSICSNALVGLGSDPINAFSGSDFATAAGSLFPQVRDRILRGHPWNCAVKRVALAPDVATPAFDYAYQFTLPGDWIRTLQVGLYGSEIDYKTEGRKILADADTLYLRYIYRNEDPATWDTLLIEVMTQAMAATMAYAVTQSTSKEEMEINKLRMMLKEARAVDGQDDPPGEFGDFPLLQSRY